MKGWSCQPAQYTQYYEDDSHEAGDPACGVPRMLENQRRVLVTRCAKDQRDRDDQREIEEQVGRRNGDHWIFFEESAQTAL